MGSKRLSLSTNSRYATTATRGSKVRASGVLACSEDVLSDLVAKGLHARELALVPETSEKGQPNPAAIEIPREIEEMGLHRELCLTEGRPDAHVDDRLVARVLHIHPAGVDPWGQEERTRRLDVRRGEAEGPAATRAAHDLTLDRVGAPEQPHRLREISTPQRAEEHTSELQSLTNLVCRLLLEKKNKEHRVRDT